MTPNNQLGVEVLVLSAHLFAVAFTTIAARPPRLPKSSFGPLSRFVPVSGSGNGGRLHCRTARIRNGRGGLLWALAPRFHLGHRSQALARQPGPLSNRAKAHYSSVVTAVSVKALSGFSPSELCLVPVPNFRCCGRAASIARVQRSALARCRPGANQGGNNESRSNRTVRRSGSDEGR